MQYLKNQYCSSHLNKIVSMHELRSSIVEEIEHQVNTRKHMAEILIEDLNGEDPIKSLPLTDYQRGIMQGRVETWSFIVRMLEELRNIYQEQGINQN